MRRAALLSFVFIALAACSPKAQNETADAANAIAADANATAAKASSDVDAALGAAENHLDAAGNKVDAATKDAKTVAGKTLKDVGNEIED